MTHLTTVDYLVILSYLAATMAIGFWVGSYVKSGSDFFLAGKTLPWWAVGMSLVATDIGGTDLVGVGGDAFRYGLVMGNFEWIGCVPAMLIAAFVFIPHLWRCGVTTIPEFLERRFSVQVRSAVAACWLVLMACNLGVMLLAAAKFMNVLAGWDISFAIVLTAVLVGIYTWSGGLGAVVYTDVLQCSVMIGSCLFIVVVGIRDMGGVEPFVDKVHAAAQVRRAQQTTAAASASADPATNETKPAAAKSAKSEHLSLVLPVDTPSPGPWPAVLFGLALIVSPGYWIGNQCIVQRSLGAKSEYEAKASYVFGALLKNFIPFLIAVPGLIALVKFPELAADQGDRALPMLVAHLLPEGVRGVFVAAFVAALMSSVDAYLNSATTVFTKDFYCRFYRPKADEAQMLGIGRWVTIGFVIWAIYFAFQLMMFSQGIYSIFQTMMSFVVGPTFAVLICGMLLTRTSSEGVLIGFISGLLTSISLVALNQPTVCGWLGCPPLFRIANAYLYYSIWAFLVTMTVTLVWSYFGRGDSPEKARYTVWGWRPEGGAA